MSADPNSRWERARSEWDREVAREASRARLAKWALVATFGVHVIMLAAFAVPLDEAFGLLTIVDVAMLVFTAVVFLRWLTCAVSLASSMSAMRLRWTSSAAVWSFFMPVVGLWRPYQVLRDLYDLLAPDAVPEPAPKPVLDGSGGYRDVPLKAAPPPRPIPHAFIGAWWAFFLGTRLIAYNDNRQTHGNILGEFLAIISAALGVFMVRAIDARVHERQRRLRHASDEELESWNLRV